MTTSYEVQGSHDAETQFHGHLSVKSLVNGASQTNIRKTSAYTPLLPTAGAQACLIGSVGSPPE